MRSREHLQRTSHAANLANETPSGTHPGSFPRRRDPRTPSRESTQAGDSIESPGLRLPPHACFPVDLQPHSSANKEQSPGIYESENFMEKARAAVPESHLVYFKKRFMPSRSMMA